MDHYLINQKSLIPSSLIMVHALQCVYFGTSGHVRYGIGNHYVKKECNIFCTMILPNQNLKHKIIYRNYSKNALTAYLQKTSPCQKQNTFSINAGITSRNEQANRDQDESLNKSKCKVTLKKMHNYKYCQYTNGNV